jgi:hypothetical protein
MPLNPNIILQIGRNDRANRALSNEARSLDMQENNARHNRGFRERSLNIQEENAKNAARLQEERLEQSRRKNLTARDRRRLQSSLEGLVAIDSLARRYQDPQEQRTAIAGYLNNRLSALQHRQASGEEIDANETLEALGILNRDGGLEELKNMAAANIEAGRALGYLESPAAAGQPGGGTGYLVERLMNENPNLSYSDALFQVQTGNRQGLTIQDGQTVPIPGFAQSRGAIEFGETAGGERAKAQFADDIAFNRQQGQNDAQNLEKIPNDLSGIIMADRQIDNLLSMPGLSIATGTSSLIPTVPGTDKSDFEAALRQLQGGAFLQARQALKGGGAISDTESNKAEQSVARMTTAQTEQVFVASMREFQEALREGLKKLKGKQEEIQARRGNGGESSPQFSPVLIQGDRGFESPLPPGGAQDGAGAADNDPLGIR